MKLTTEVPYADLNALDDAFRQHPGEYACVIMETVRGEGPPDGFLQGCVEIAHSHDALCIFDEIKVGFRVAYGGAGHRWGATPDMSTFGKACCNGYPGSFIAGRKEVLGHPNAQEAWLAATFHCDTLSLTAMATVLDEMEKRDGIAYQWEIGQRLIDGLNGVTREHEIGYRLEGPGPNADARIGSRGRGTGLRPCSAAAWPGASTCRPAIRCSSPWPTVGKTSTTPLPWWRNRPRT